MGFGAPGGVHAVTRRCIPLLLLLLMSCRIGPCQMHPPPPRTNYARGGQKLPVVLHSYPFKLRGANESFPPMRQNLVTW